MQLYILIGFKFECIGMDAISWNFGNQHGNQYTYFTHKSIPLTTVRFLLTKHVWNIASNLELSFALQISL